MPDELVKQEQNRINNNPTGKGGFKDNPHLINRNGRPKSGMSWADIVKMVGEETNPETGKERRELVVRAVFREALNGNMAAMRLLWNSVVGNKILVEGNLDVSGDRLEAVLDELLTGRDRNNTETN